MDSGQIEVPGDHYHQTGTLIHENTAVVPSVFTVVPDGFGNCPATAVNDRWYFVLGPVSDPVNTMAAAITVEQIFTGSNVEVNDLYPVFSVWNGAYWSEIFGYVAIADYRQNSSSDFYIRVPGFLNAVAADPTTAWGTTDCVFIVHIPSMAQETTVSGVSGLCVRVEWRQKNAPGGSISACTSTGVVTVSRPMGRDASNLMTGHLAHVAKVSVAAGRMYLTFRSVEQSANPDMLISVAPRLDSPYPLAAAGMTATRFYVIPPRRPMSVAVVPDTGDCYVADSGTFYRYRYATMEKWGGYPPVGYGFVDDSCPVESSSGLVGPGARYSTQYIAQRTEFPRANIVAYWGNRLWAADETSVYWTPPSPAHNIWPLLSVEPVTDGSETITAMAPYGSSMVVFTESSIYTVTPVGEDSFGLLTVAIRKVVTGVGCVAPNSVSMVDGRLVFLGEESLYAFDGSSAVVDLTVGEGGRRLPGFFQSIVRSRRGRAAGVYWRKRGLYLLSVETALDSNDNEPALGHVLVWDAKNNTFWKWRLPAPTCWLLDNENEENERLCFGTYGPWIYELGPETDAMEIYGAARSPTVVTHQFGDATPRYKAFRQVSLTVPSGCTAVAVEGRNNAEESEAAFAATVSFDDPFDATWPADDGVDKWGTSRQRARQIGIRLTATGMSVKVTAPSNWSNGVAANAKFELGYIETEFAELKR
jgi:hypothetical protein